MPFPFDTMKPKKVRSRESRAIAISSIGAVSAVKSIGDFELALQSLNDDRERCVTGFSLRFAKLNPFQSPICIGAGLWGGSFHENANEGFAAWIRTFHSGRDCSFQGRAFNWLPVFESSINC